MTGWFLLALKTAEMAGLESPVIEESFERVTRLLGPAADYIRAARCD